jgi:hypothetical protein
MTKKMDFSQPRTKISIDKLIKTVKTGDHEESRQCGRMQGTDHLDGWDIAAPRPLGEVSWQGVRYPTTGGLVISSWTNDSTAPQKLCHSFLQDGWTVSHMPNGGRKCTTCRSPLPGEHEMKWIVE